MDESKKVPSRPGEAALQNMKLLKSECSVFKVPNVPQKKSTTKKLEVLEEELYVEGISKIIQRDFFPDLEKLNAQNEFLEATENKDYAKLREITRKYSGNRPPTEPYDTPATFDTPTAEHGYVECAATVREHRPDPPDKHTDIIDKHSLDSFLASHTSEDNASYDKVIAIEDKKRANKLMDQYDAERSSQALVVKHVELPSIEAQADQSKRPDEVQTWRYTAKNYIMYVPDGSCTAQVIQKPELRRHNTRLVAEPFDQRSNRQAIQAIAKSQDATISGKIGIDGVCLSSDKGSSSAYSLVATPSPLPGAGPDQSPLMTWGEIEGTPFRLDAGDTPLPTVGAGAAYRMLEGGARERIALQLAEQVAKKRRPTTPRVAPATPSFRTNSERLASMSPAARKLAAKHLMSPRSRLTPADMGIFTHMATPKRTPTPHRRNLVATPTSKMAANKPIATCASTVTSAENNLTDNLLQINVVKRDRLKAQDFFK